MTPVPSVSFLQNNIVYSVTGHAFMLEDGSETGHIMDGNLVMLTQASLAQNRCRRKHEGNKL